MELFEEDLNPFYSLKFDVLGANMVGKTILCKRISADNNGYEFREYLKQSRNMTTIGSDFFITIIKFNNEVFKLTIQDHTGIELYIVKTIHNIFKGTYAVLILYDACNRQSFEMAQRICMRKANINKKALCFLIRSNYGIIKNNHDIVSDEEAIEFAAQNNLYFTHIDCFEKYETGLKELFSFIFTTFLKDKNKDRYKKN